MQTCEIVAGGGPFVNATVHSELQLYVTESIVSVSLMLPDTSILTMVFAVPPIGTSPKLPPLPAVIVVDSCESWEIRSDEQAAKPAAATTTPAATNRWVRTAA
jgi:hypothetical protein